MDGYTGIWIRREIMQDMRLSHFEKLLIGEMEAYASKGGAFWKSNEQISLDYGVSLSTAKNGVKTACEYGYAMVASFNGRVRQIQASMIAGEDLSGRLNNDPAAGSNNDRQPVKKRTGRRLKNDPADGLIFDMQPVKKRPTKRTKENNKEKNNEIIYPYPFNSDAFKSAWAEWKDYKKSQHRFTFKTAKTEQISIQKLHNDTHGNEQHAIATIAQSIASGYKGLFADSAKRSLRDAPIDKGRTLEWLDR
jgi:hypothetical protein